MAEIRKVEEEVKTAKPSQEETAEKIYDNVKKGVMKLVDPFSIGSETYEELEWDFTKISGWDYAAACDIDTNKPNVFRLSQVQALALFAKAVNKCSTLDWQDVMNSISGADAINAIQTATVFFVSAGRRRDRLSTKA